jgi:tetratricopeptide (TPR) repeat protein
MKTLFILPFLMLLAFQSAFSQTKKIEDLYLDYTQVRNSPNRKAAKEKSLTLMERSAELNEKQIANVNFHLAGLYEESKESELAIPYYEKVIKIVPGYYVAQRALGFIHLKKCDVLGRKVTAAAQAKNEVLYAESLKAYKKQVLLTIPYLEKSQACDPDDNTLNILSGLYKNIKATTSLTTLDGRLKELAKDCVSLLDE